MEPLNIAEIITAEIKGSLTKAGLLLFIAGFIIFMGIITGEIYYPLVYNSRANYISELAASIDPLAAVPKPSALIFNTTMIVSGLMIMLAGFYVHSIFKKYLSSIPLGLFGLGLLGVGIFPGNVVPWHGIFAFLAFIAGGTGAITSAKIVKAPLKYIFIFFGIIALILTGTSKLFVPSLGVGGTERWLVYSIVFWITGLGAYLLGIKDEFQQSRRTKKASAEGI